MSFTLKLHGVVVGRSELEHRNPAQRLRWGVFRTSAGYSLVEPVFALGVLPGDVERYEKARRTLALELLDANGVRVQASQLEILPDEKEAGRLVLQARIDDPAFWG